MNVNLIAQENNTTYAMSTGLKFLETDYYENSENYSQKTDLKQLP